jgi:DNA-directed RNA polymerase specialized sigma24 family protein
MDSRGDKFFSRSGFAAYVHRIVRRRKISYLVKNIEYLPVPPNDAGETRQLAEAELQADDVSQVVEGRKHSNE